MPAVTIRNLSDATHRGQFIFNQKILIAKSIMSRNGKGCSAQMSAVSRTRLASWVFIESGALPLAGGMLRVEAAKLGPGGLRRLVDRPIGSGRVAAGGCPRRARAGCAGWRCR